MVEHMSYNSNFAFSTSENGGLTGIQGNRSRLDSGTSGSSESSRGSGKPPRRRSHRPRGCRGGSNRRRNNAEKRNMANKGNSNKTNGDGKGRLDKKTILSKHSKTMKKGNNFAGSQLDDFNLQGRRVAVDTKTFTDCQMQASLYRQNSSNSLSTSQATDYSSSSYDDPTFIHVNPHEVSIRQSFSDSSSELGLDPATFSTHSGTTAFGRESQILPPLPAKAFQNEPTPGGPNPYALKLANHQTPIHTSNSDHLKPTHSRITAGGYATANKEQPAMLILPNHNDNQAENVLDSNIHNMGPPLPRRPSRGVDTSISNSVLDRTTDVYRSERLDIQRQNVEGGSLFLTSPRSFLMGKRSSNAVL